jgi:hypothetical protein
LRHSARAGTAPRLDVAEPVGGASVHSARAVRRLFYLALAALAVFELAAVWLIMPLPGSQRMHSVELAYALHRWRWPVRGVLAALALAALPWAWRSAGRRRARWPVAASLAAVARWPT